MIFKTSHIIQPVVATLYTQITKVILVDNLVLREMNLIDVAVCIMCNSTRTGSPLERVLENVEQSPCFLIYGGEIRLVVLSSGNMME